MARRSGMVGLESGVKLFVPLLVIFLFLADIGLYYVFNRLQDIVLDSFDRGLVAAAGVVEAKLDPVSTRAFVENRTGPEYARAVRKKLMAAAVEGKFLGAFIVNRDQEVLADSRAIDQTGAVLNEELGRVWAGNEVFLTLEGENGLWTRYVFVPLSESGRIFAALAVGSDFSLHSRMMRATKAYMLVRLLFLLSLVGAVLLFVMSVLRPFQRMKRTALVVRGEPTDEEDSEFIVSTFQKVVADLREKETQLQRLLAEQTIKADSLEEYNEYVLSSMSGGLVSTNLEGLVTTFNRAAGDMLGISPEDALNHSYDEVLAGTPLAGMLEEALKQGVTRTGVDITLPGERDAVSLSASSSVLRGDKDEPVGAALLLTDITELKRLQDKVLLREKLASLGEMSAGIAHQFRNSLGSIIGYASLLKKKGVTISTVDKILKESKILNEMVESFLNFARPVNLMPSEVNLSSLIDETLEPFREEMREREIEESLLFEKSGVSVIGDGVLLKQALANFFRNSLDAMERGGSLEVRSAVDSETAVLKIKDTGRGIPPDQVAHIFTPFFSLTEGGVGLGLPIAHRIITSHRGTIEVESEVSSGTTFTITLPLKGELGE